MTIRLSGASTSGDSRPGRRCDGEGSLTAEQRTWSGRHSADFELKVKMRANRETCAADIADLPALLDLLPKCYGHLRHMGVDLHQAETVGDLNADTEGVC